VGLKLQLWHWPHSVSTLLASEHLINPYDLSRLRKWLSEVYCLLQLWLKPINQSPFLPAKTPQMFLSAMHAYNMLPFAAAVVPNLQLWCWLEPANTPVASKDIMHPDDSSQSKDAVSSPSCSAFCCSCGARTAAVALAGASQHPSQQKEPFRDPIMAVFLPCMSCNLLPVAAAVAPKLQLWCWLEPANTLPASKDPMDPHEAAILDGRYEQRKGWRNRQQTREKRRTQARFRFWSTHHEGEVALAMLGSDKADFVGGGLEGYSLTSPW